MSAPPVDAPDLGPVLAWESWWTRTKQLALERRHDDPVCARAVGQGFVLTTADLIELGVSRGQLRARVANGSWTAVRAGAVSPFDLRDRTADEWLLARRRHALSASAAALCNPTQVVSGRSAAILYGLPTVLVPARPMLTVERHRHGLTDGAVHARRAGMLRREVCSWFGIPATVPARTLLDLARENRSDALMAADAALRESLVTDAELRGAAQRATGWPGVRAARDVLALADRLAESPLESLLRLAIHDAGLPAPELQVPVAVPGRSTPYRVDLLWPAQRLIVEADGLGKYTGAALRQEKRREQQLRRLGYRVERVIWSDVVDEWPLTEALLREALGC